jgi:hypothetical protein
LLKRARSSHECRPQNPAQAQLKKELEQVFARHGLTHHATDFYVNEVHGVVQVAMVASGHETKEIFTDKPWTGFRLVNPL